MARAGLSAEPIGAGMSRTMALSTSGTPSPVLALIRRTSSGSQPMILLISSAYLSGCAAGRSILLSTGMMCRSFSSAR